MWAKVWENGAMSCSLSVTGELGWTGNAKFQRMQLRSLSRMNEQDLID